MYETNSSPCAPWQYNSVNKIKNALEEHLPPLVTRKKAAELSGNFITPKTLANYDAMNLGPQNKIMVGRQVGYFKEDFIEFFLRLVK
jgi:hypothetical protein